MEKSLAIVDKRGGGLTFKLLELMEKTGYPIVQHNGQRKFGPPPEWLGPPPPKGCEVFVGKLPREIFEDELVPIFARIGKIYELRLMMDFSGSNRGYAFVTYVTRAEAYRAVKDLNGYEIRPGRHIGVVKSVDNCRLFVGNIPKDKTKEEILEELSRRVSGIVDVILYKNCYDKRLNRGFAFVEFTCHRAAAMARRVLVPGCAKIWDQDLMVDWAEPEPDVDDEQMRRHLDKKEYAYSPKEDEGIGSGYAGSTCGSPELKALPYPSFAITKDSYSLAPAKLDAMCKRYMWAPPVFDYQKCVNTSGTEVWIGRVELPHVGLPLLSTPQRIGPLATQPCFSLQQAQVEAAETALHYIKMLRIDAVQRSAAPVQAVYQPVLPPMPSCLPMPYDYSSLYSRPQPAIPVTLPAIWRTV